MWTSIIIIQDQYEQNNIHAGILKYIQIPYTMKSSRNKASLIFAEATSNMYFCGFYDKKTQHFNL